MINKLDFDETIKIRELAEILGISERQIQRLVKENVIHKNDKGKYLFYKSVRSYINYLRELEGTPQQLQEEKLKEEIKKIKKDTELKALKISELKNQLHPAMIIEKVMTESLMNLKGRLLSLSNRLAPQLIALDNLGEIQEVIQDSILETLEELSEYSPELFKNKNFIEDNEEEESVEKVEKQKRGRPKKSK